MQGRALAAMGTTFAEIGESMRKARADQAFSQASLEGAKLRNQVELDAAEDNEFQDFDDRYKKRLTDGLNEISKTIKDREAKERFQLDYEQKSLYSYNRIQKDGRGRFVAYDKELMEQELAEAKQKIFMSTTDTEKKERTDELASIIQQRVKNGIFTGPEGVNRRRKEMEGLVEGQIDYDIETNAELALVELQLGGKGKYADADASMRLQKEITANAKVERDKKITDKAINESHTTNELDLTLKYFADGLTLDMVKGMFPVGISQKYAGVLSTLLTTPKAIDATTEDAEYGKLITAYLNLDESKLDDLRKFRVKVLGLHAAGSLSRNDAEFLINKTVDPFTQQKAEGKGFFASAIGAIKNWAETSPTPYGIAHMINKLFNRVDEKSIEEDIIKAGQDIIAEEQKAINPNRSRYEIGDIIKLRSGEWKVVGYKDDGDPIIEKQ